MDSAEMGSLSVINALRPQDLLLRGNTGLVQGKCQELAEISRNANTCGFRCVTADMQAQHLLCRCFYEYVCVNWSACVRLRVALCLHYLCGVRGSLAVLFAWPWQSSSRCLARTPAAVTFQDTL